MFSFEPVENCQHAADVVLRLPIGRDAAMPLHRLGARVVAANAPNRPVSDFMSDDVESAMERMVARKPFVEGKFSRGAVNKRFRSGDHRDLMRQQMW